MSSLTVRKMQTGEEDATFSLVERVFNTFVESDLNEQGKREFFCSAKKIIYEKPSDHRLLVGCFSGEILGMIDMRTDGHICLFFVSRNAQRKGIGRKLLEHAQAELVKSKSTGVKIDVNSSLYAVNAYEKLGFCKSKEAQTFNGIQYVPMIKRTYD
ncbi:Ribosomal protein S18 acetylase RimI [Alteromonadaceae bacterium Bs31]|nr:Ribosomal protein S18 acetylase RimI [Alteromonadaceae bacterium Bs31]